jgi:hypothetical protein
MPRYKLSLCHTPIKPDLLGFLGIGVFACGLRDHVITLSLLGQRSYLTYQCIIDLVASFHSIPMVLVLWNRFLFCHTFQP